MAKGKKKRGGQGKAHLPKRIAGLKIPRSVRKSWIGEFLASPIGRTMLVEAAVFAGGPAAARAADDPRVAAFARHPVSSLRHAGGETLEAVTDAGSHVTHALAEAARAFADSLQRPRAGIVAAEPAPEPERRRRPAPGEPSPAV